MLELASLFPTLVSAQAVLARGFEDFGSASESFGPTSMRILYGKRHG